MTPEERVAHIGRGCSTRHVARQTHCTFESLVWVGVYACVRACVCACVQPPPLTTAPSSECALKSHQTLDSSHRYTVLQPSPNDGTMECAASPTSANRPPHVAKASTSTQLDLCRVCLCVCVCVCVRERA